MISLAKIFESVMVAGPAAAASAIQEIGVKLEQTQARAIALERANRWLLAEVQAVLDLCQEADREAFVRGEPAGTLETEQIREHMRAAGDAARVQVH